eukprot:Lithocolla_globosa_v1_NODE_2512_length_1968_cov_5.787768.p2 type:complete len:108 gc:universal NODE_2512_length_1968_cov_5.787768:951-1274(+)
MEKLLPLLPEQLNQLSNRLIFTESSSAIFRVDLMDLPKQMSGTFLKESISVSTESSRSAPKCWVEMQCGVASNASHGCPPSSVCNLVVSTGRLPLIRKITPVSNVRL